MKPSEVLQYAESIAAWDKKHRIVGKTPPELLIRESLDAISHFSDFEANATLVDLGAGSGLLGIPWLYSHLESSAVFIEPDKKKTAFLHYYLSSFNHLKGRYQVLSAKIQNVSRETVCPFNRRGRFVVARAFSGEESLSDAIEASEFKNESLYVFSSSPSGHRFLKWSK